MEDEKALIPGKGEGVTRGLNWYSRGVRDRA